MQPNPRRRVLALTVLTAVAGASVAAVTAAVPVAAVAQATGTPGATRAVVVTGPDAAGAVRAAGGRVTVALPLVHGVAAVVPVAAVLPSSYVVADDRPLRPAGLPQTAATTSTASSPTRQVLGLPAAPGGEGSGVTVALVDTGIDEVPGLGDRVAGHINTVPSGAEPAVDPTRPDGYGHGTFLAGLIAGPGGVAPASRVLDVRVADSQGNTRLSWVLRGLQSVADSGDNYGVRVVALALESGSPLPPEIDPLDQALDQLWRDGLTVVVAAGNEGSDGVTAPGTDPMLLTVGALDDTATPARADDTVPSWSGQGGDHGRPDERTGPDLVAPGVHTVGLRAPGSVIDQANPQARVGTDGFRGSGTSMATAVAAGAAADVAAIRPDLTPDDVVALFTGTAYTAAGLGDATAAGAGGLDLAAALSAAPGVTAGLTEPVAVWQQLLTALQQDDMAGATAAWNALDPASRSWAARVWGALSPDARAWAARAWAGRSWAASPTWLARAWAARAWAGRSWAARSWAARSWAARSWAGRSWAARSWAGRSWAADDWSARAWSARSWAADSW
jgi:serine protease AprX